MTAFGNSFGSWTPGATLGNFRELQFGQYRFPLTMQERNRESKLALLKKKIPLIPGDYNPGNVSMVGSSTEFYGTAAAAPVGYGSNGKIAYGMLSGIPSSSSLAIKHPVPGYVVTQDNLETERAYLAGLQQQGNQQLWVRNDRFCMARLEDFTHSFVDGTSFREADWSAKFYMEDPRYYAPTPGVTVKHTSADGHGPFTFSISHAGNVKAFPIVTFNGAVTAPWISIYNVTAGGHIKLTFSQLVGASGDQLTIYCDPRPDSAQNPAIWVHGGIAQNAMAQVQPSDFDNTLDYQYFLPYIETSAYQQQVQSFRYGIGSAPGNWSINVAWSDTFL